MVALFVVRKDPALTAEALIEFARNDLTGYKVPKHVYFRDELPKTNVGKILRRALRDETPEEAPERDALRRELASPRHHHRLRTVAQSATPLALVAYGNGRVSPRAAGSRGARTRRSVPRAGDDRHLHRAARRSGSRA